MKLLNEAIGGRRGTRLHTQLACTHCPHGHPLKHLLLCPLTCAPVHVVPSLPTFPKLPLQAFSPPLLCARWWSLVLGTENKEQTIFRTRAVVCELPGQFFQFQHQSLPWADHHVVHAGDLRPR